MSSKFHTGLLSNVHHKVYMINQSDEPTIIKRKSDFDLTVFATLKVPKTQYLELKEIADGMRLHWSELARRILRAWIKDEKKESVTE